MGVNKLLWRNDTVFDISDTTAVESDVAEGKIFYGADGDQKVGTATGGGGGYSEYAIGGSLVGGTATGYVIDPSAQKIRKYAFADYDSINRIDIPSSVTLIEEGVFTNCSAEIHGGENVEEVDDGGLYGCQNQALDIGPELLKAKTIAFSAMANLETVDFPKLSDFGTSPSVTSTSYHGTFAECSKLASASLASATWIPAYTFSHCASLTSLYSPNATIIAPYAFVGCSLLQGDNLTFGQLTQIGEHAFDSCINLNASLDLPSVERVYTSAFTGSGLISLKVGSIMQGALPTVGVMPFLEHLESADNTYNCTTVNASAFSSCPKLEDLILPNVITYNIQAIPAYSQTSKLKNLKFKWAGTLSGSTITGGVTISNFPTSLANARVLYADDGYLLAAYRASSGSIVYIHTIENGVISGSPDLTLNSNTTVSQYSLNGKILAFKKSGTTSSQTVKLAVIG